MNAFSQMIKDARKAQQLSQMDLRDLSGVSASVIYKLETGRSDVTLSSLLAVSDALGIELLGKSPLGTEIKING
jgi:transcriptional regulator with XRE-family HTH domain